MKRTFDFFENKNNYLIKANKEVVFEIEKSTLKIDGNKLYYTLFDKFNIGDTINIKNKIEQNGDRKSEIVYTEFVKIVREIVERINSGK